MRRFELVEGTASKFWEVRADAAQLTVRFGRIGTQGQTQVKSFGSAALAEAERDRLVRDKTRKGYVELARTSVVAATVSADPPIVPKAATTSPSLRAPGAAKADSRRPEETASDAAEPVQRRVRVELPLAPSDEREAGADELPPALASPPWLASRTGVDVAPRAPTRVVAVPPVEEKLLVDGGRMGRLWGNEMPGDDEQGRLARLLYDLGASRDLPALRALDEESALELLRTTARNGKGRTWIGTGLSRAARSVLLRELAPARWAPTSGFLDQLVAEEGIHAVDALSSLASGNLELVVAAMAPLRSPRLAPIAAEALGRKKVRAAAERWLRMHPEAATAGLLGPALGHVARLRASAEAALRWLNGEGHGATLRAIAERAGVAAEVDALLAHDPTEDLPAKVPVLPDFVRPTALPRLALRSGKIIGADATLDFARLLAMSKLDQPRRAVVEVRDACTPASTQAFSLALFEAWCADGAPSKEAWALTQLAFLGGDAAARELARLARAWPGQNAHPRAVLGLDVLAAMGTDAALMQLYGMSLKGKFKALLDVAREKVRELAARRGLTPAQLGDRLIPDLGLDPDGSMQLDFGARSFRVGFDEQLRPFVCTIDGGRLADLPKPRAEDDPARAAEAIEVWKALKRDVRGLAKQQIDRLQTAMLSGRRWPLAEFRAFIVDHPLLIHLARCILWGAYDAHGELVTPFRVSEDRTFADANDEGVALPADATVGVVHPIELPSTLLAQLGQVFGDYGILQPFPQLGRDLHRVAPEDAEAIRKQWHGRVVPSVRVMSLESRGWRRGEVWDAGIVHAWERAAPDGISAVIHLDPGIAIGSPSMVPEQTVQAVTLPFGPHVRHRIALSEVLRDLQLLVG